MLLRLVALAHVLKTDADRPPVSLKLLNLGQLHNSLANVLETLGGQVGAGDVLDERGEVDTRVLLGAAVGSYMVLC